MNTALRNRIRVLVFSLIAVAGLAPAPLRAETMDNEIDYLLDTVAASNCTFIRNGKEYDADDARDHLQSKRRRGKRYFDSTEEFIERLASKSSMSGKPYQIRCGDDAAVPAGEWFTALLMAHRAGQ
jgi:hypothetical protein